LNGRVVYQYPNAPLPMIGAADRASFYQLKTMLQGVVDRGTARAIKPLSPYVAGKTGTTEDAVDGWFVGFTNDVTIAVWVGYDNGDGKRRSLGSSETGAKVALPIFEPVIEAIWAQHVAPKAVLNGPSREAARLLVDAPIDYMSGNRVNGGGFIEHFKVGPDGRVADTQYELIPREQADSSRYQEQQQWGSVDQGGYYGSDGGWVPGRSYYPNQGWQQGPPQPQQPQPLARGLFSPYSGGNDPRQPPQRRDQDYFWGGRLN
jgi:penicillin-binding protein 1A